jgi:hypothetical protein
VLRTGLCEAQTLCAFKRPHLSTLCGENVLVPKYKRTREPHPY